MPSCKGGGPYTQSRGVDIARTTVAGNTLNAIVSERGSRTSSLLVALGLFLGLLFGSALAGSEVSPLTVSFLGQDFVHRWSEGDQHELTPVGQEDLSSWTDMLTLVVYPDVWDGEELAVVANNVLSHYRARGLIIKTDSKRRTLRRPAEHLIIAALTTPELIEVVFARLMLVDDTGLAVVASHRIHGARAGEDASAWIEANGPTWEQALMSWTSIPSPSVLDSLDAPADETAALMTTLRGHLEAVRISPPPAESQPRPLPDVAKLVGLSRRQVQDGLGEPARCRLNDPRFSMAPPCETASRWVYAFYRLAPGSRGGGLELVIEFGADGVSISSEWQRTQ